MAIQLAPDEIFRLWPTTVLKHRFADHECPNAELAALARARAPGDVFDLDRPCIGWLAAQVSHAVAAYLERAGACGVRFARPRGAFDVHGFGQYRGLANRAPGDLSGMYCVSFPSVREPLQTRDDLRPGFLSFYDPRAGMNMTAIRGDPYQGYHRSLAPVPGLLLLWPSHVRYFVHPNLSRQPRIGVVFDVDLEAEGAPPAAA